MSTYWALVTTGGWKHTERGIRLTKEQLLSSRSKIPTFGIVMQNPAAPASYCQDTFSVERLKGVGNNVSAFYGSYAFGFLHISQQPEAAVAVLHNDVLPFYRHPWPAVGAGLTDNGTEFCGVVGHPYETYLELNDIQHHRTKIKSPQTNGFVERFNRTVSDELFRVKFREKFYKDVPSLQKDLDEWLRFYNHERPHLGYRNQGGDRTRRYHDSPRKMLGK